MGARHVINRGELSEWMKISECDKRETKKRKGRIKSKRLINCRQVHLPSEICAILTDRSGSPGIGPIKACLTFRGLRELVQCSSRAKVVRPGQGPYGTCSNLLGVYGKLSDHPRFKKINKIIAIATFLTCQKARLQGARL